MAINYFRHSASKKGPTACCWHCCTLYKCPRHFSKSASYSVPAGSSSRGGDVVVYVKQPSLQTPLCFCAYFCLYGPFNCISFHKFSRQLSAFSLCSSGLIFALLVLSVQAGNEWSEQSPKLLSSELKATTTTSPFNYCIFLKVLRLSSPRAHFHVVGMLRFKFLT